MSIILANVVHLSTERNVAAKHERRMSGEMVRAIFAVRMRSEQARKWITERMSHRTPAHSMKTTNDNICFPDLTTTLTEH